ncbi:AsmA family protein [Acidisoma cellulosilytica]|uniref:AsmA family protein n=1 Tax=Acidisoma cellulosilyticum TaxID=2802395 RepID=A0A963Z100_9PROT|nr:AsmA family protein [Acidisoma cellulosilyticum]MCB8880843.1 AsmA family protein [Acidisoma cellulosilyticum]
MVDTPEDKPYRTSRPIPRRRPWRRILLGGIAVIIVVPVVAVVAAVLTFNPNAYKDQITAAASQATGRQVTIAGPIAVKLSLIPTLTAQDVRIANIAGGAAPLMARISSIETRIALLPLLHHQIDIEALVLRHPTILLEKTADGRVNWLFQPTSNAAAPAAVPAPPVTVDTGHGPWQVAVHSLDITDGTVDWRDEQAGRTATVQLPKASLSAQGDATTQPEDQPLAIDADLLWQKQPIHLTAKTGPIAHLTNTADQSSWPVQLTLTAAGATLSAQGGITDPRQARGYDLTLQAQIPALDAITPLLPQGILPAGQSLPPLHGVAFGAHLTDASQGKPQLSNLSLQAQASDLSGIAPGLKLDSLSLVTAAPDQPVSVNILGDRQGLAFTLSGSIGPLPLPGAPAAPLPVDLTLNAAQSNLHAQGSIQDPWSLRGLNLALSAQIANLAFLSPLAGAPLPAFTTLNGTATLTDAAASGLAQGLALSALNLTAPQGDLEGALSIAFAPRLAIGANLRSAKLDLDQVLTATATTPAAPAAAPAPQPAAPAPATAAGPRKLIPDIALPIAALKSFDGSADLAFADLHFGGADYRALVAKASLSGGVLSLAPSSVVVPGGQLLAAGTIDTRGAVPTESFAMQAQNLAIAPLLKALQIPVAANGLVQVFANLTASGATTRQIAASVNGNFGLASVDGVIDAHALGSLIAPAIRAGGVVPAELLNAAGQVPMRCLAIRLNATNGNAAVAALLLDTPRLLVQGTGSLNFGLETLNLALTPELYLGEMAVTVPLDMGGTFADPHAGKVGKVVISQQPGQSGGSGLNGLVQSLIGGGKHAAPAVSPACTPALTLARNGQPGPAPSGSSDSGILQKPMNLFQQLLHGQ